MRRRNSSLNHPLQVYHPSIGPGWSLLLHTMMGLLHLLRLSRSRSLQYLLLSKQSLRMAQSGSIDGIERCIKICNIQQCYVKLSDQIYKGYAISLQMPDPTLVIHNIVDTKVHILHLLEVSNCNLRLYNNRSLSISALAAPPASYNPPDFEDPAA
ncbi:hypothetical protein CJ030_MR5G016140 [Morella rubra]|uniref:Uncharacterized protein n=1 Tax=Morella rubra TaxID=262757 RepID=A0A6A1VM58_9ROSI|nr:hypothetical protein CJ030_MR5G016140 [Morella rubra]